MFTSFIRTSHVMRVSLHLTVQLSTALVCWGRHDIVPQARGLEQQKGISSQAWELGVGRVGVF